MSAVAPASQCERCACRLARDNAGPHCSPCAARVGQERWLAPGWPAPVVLSAVDLEDLGVKGLMARHGITAEVAIPALLHSGALPRHIRRYENLVTRLVDMDGLSHSAAARQLRLTRWTVASWRRRLGLDDRGRCLHSTARTPPGIGATTPDPKVAP